MPECDNCGEWVSHGYKKLFEHNGVLDQCQECGPQIRGGMSP